MGNRNKDIFAFLFFPVILASCSLTSNISSGSSTSAANASPPYENWITNGTVAGGAYIWPNAPSNEKFDILTVDWEGVDDTPYTYWSTEQWNGGEEFGPGYAGFQNIGTTSTFSNLDPSSQAATHVTIFTLWDTPIGIANIVYSAPGSAASHYGPENGPNLEGYFSHCLYPYAWVTGRWYRMVIRCWDNSTNVRFGQWVKDISAGTWLLISYIEAPIAGTRIDYFAEFMENYGGTASNRSCCIKNIYGRNTSGSWLSIDSVTFQGGGPTNWDFGATSNYFWLIGGCFNIIPQYTNSQSFTVIQPSLPSMDTIAIQDFNVSYSSGVLYASWVIPVTSSPQFSYTIEIFSNSNLSGPALASNTVIEPETTNAELTANLPSGSYFAILTIGDIFDNTLSSTCIFTSGQ